MNRASLMKMGVLAAAFSAVLLAQAPVAPLGPDTVVANIDGRDVTAGELRSLLEHAPPPILQTLRQNPKLAIQQLYMMRYLASEGEKQNLADRSPLKEELENLRMNVIAGAMLNQARDGYTVTMETITDFYNRNQSRYQQAKIKAILIKFSAAAPAAAPTPQSVEEAAKAAFGAAHDATTRSEAEAKTLAADLVAKARGGADFAKLAAEFSDDAATKASGGDFGTVTATSSYPDEIKRAVLSLKADEVSDPVRVSNGFYILRVQEKSVQPMTELLDPISQELRQAHLNEWFNGVTKRFEPAVKNQEFFARPGDFLSAQPPAPRQAVPATPKP